MQPRFEAGYWRSMRQPAFLVQASLSLEGFENTLKEFDAIRAEVFSRADYGEITALVAGDQAREHPVLARVLSLALQILEKMGMPIMSGARAVPMPDRESAQSWQVGVSAISGEITAPLRALSFASGLMNALAGGLQVRAPSVASELKRLVRQFQPLAPSGVNTLRFLQAAHELDIPWCHVANNVYQFGWGRNSRWLDSSFTDQTSQISAGLARDKVACARVLRDAGVPVPKHQLVGNVEQAARVARLLGYPVVVKPADLDGGKGVFAGLGTPELVGQAYKEARKLSQRILVEQFICGDDFRLQVYQGEVFWAVIRRPARVCGDGSATVAQLVEQTNLERKQAISSDTKNPMQEQGSSAIVLDDEALSWLKSQNLGLNDVPEPGQYVRLRGAANVGIGGTREGVPLNQIHPDNLALAAKAVAALRLDLAGVDFLTPDISKSWREVGGAICEVNAQPQLAGHLHRQLLPKLVSMKGRIPVVAIYLYGELKVKQDLEKHLLKISNCRTVVVRSAQECRQALLDPSVDALVWMLMEEPQGQDSSPVDVFDVLIIPSKLVPSVSRCPPPDHMYSWRGLHAARAWIFDQGLGEHVSASDLPDELRALFPEGMLAKLSSLPRLSC